MLLEIPYRIKVRWNSVFRHVAPSEVGFELLQHNASLVKSWEAYNVLAWNVKKCSGICYYEQIDGKTVEITGGIPFEIPESWCWCRLGNLCDYGKCQSVEPSEIKASDWVLDLEDIEKDSGRLLCRIKKQNRPPTSSKHVFNKGNVLYSKLRTYLNKVLVADQAGYCTSEILPLDFGKYILPEFARCVLMSKMFLDYTARCGYGVKMPRLGTEDGRKALFPLPPIQEQGRITGAITQYESILKLLRE